MEVSGRRLPTVKMWAVMHFLAILELSNGYALDAECVAEAIRMLS